MSNHATPPATAPETAQEPDTAATHAPATAAAEPATAPVSHPATANTPAPPAAPVRQKHNPLHGVTLEAMVTALSTHYGWPGLAERIPVRCFALDPSVQSSLKFLRKTPWARDKVEGLYLFMQREQRRAGQR
jgi:hypothetical protein